MLQQALHIGGRVLPVAIHEYHGVVRGIARAGLDTGAVALAVLVGNHPHTARRADRKRVVRGAIVDHDDFRGREHGAQFRQEAAQVDGLVAGRQDN